MGQTDSTRFARLSRLACTCIVLLCAATVLLMVPLPSFAADEETSGTTQTESQTQTDEQAQADDQAQTTGETLDGIDISKWQNGIDVSKIDCDFVICKASEGLGYTDPNCYEYAEDVLASGKLLGFYHYARGNDPVAEADYFVSVVKAYSGNAVYALDWETAETSENTEFFNTDYALKWLNRVYELTGVRPLLYTSRYFTFALDWTNVAAAGYSLWCAQYGDNPVVQGFQENPFTGSIFMSYGAFGVPVMRQYSSNTYLEGYEHNLDVDKFYGSVDDWKTLQGVSTADVKSDYLQRVAGDTRYDTMQKIANRAYPKTANTVILARGDVYADALTSSALAGLGNAPIVLTNSTTLSPQAQEELERLQPDTVVVCGGTTAVSESVATAAGKAAGASNVVRLGGATRVETAAIILCDGPAAVGAEGWGTGSVILATGANFADALSVASLAYVKHIPIVLVSDPESVPMATVNALTMCQSTDYYVVGGPAVISTAAVLQVQQMGLTFNTRLWGQNRYETSQSIAEYAYGLGLSANKSVVTTGANFPDALCGAVLAGKNKSTILLVDESARTCVNGFVTTHADQIDRLYVLGGPNAVSHSVFNSLALTIPIAKEQAQQRAEAEAAEQEAQDQSGEGTGEGTGTNTNEDQNATNDSSQGTGDNAAGGNGTSVSSDDNDNAAADDGTGTTVGDGDNSTQGSSTTQGTADDNDTSGEGSTQTDGTGSSSSSGTTNSGDPSTNGAPSSTTQTGDSDDDSNGTLQSMPDDQNADGADSGASLTTAGWEACGTCEWKISEEGVLTIRPVGGLTGQLQSFEGEDSPWYNDTSITSIVIEDGVVAGSGTNLMFGGCTNLKSADLSGLDTTNVTDMSSMFCGCSSLESLDLSSFETANVTSFAGMFKDCSSLEALDLSSFDTSKATQMDDMFCGCIALDKVVLGQGFGFAGDGTASCSLPYPGDDDGYSWKNQDTEEVYKPADVPSNVAATYVAVPDLAQGATIDDVSD